MGQDICKDTASNLRQVASFEAEFIQSNSVNKSSKKCSQRMGSFYSYLLSDLDFE